MFSRKKLSYIFLILILTTQACTIQGLPYPTDTSDPNLITPDLAATREMAEAGMFPTHTPPPEPSATTEPSPAPTPTGITFRIPSQTLKLVYIIDGNLWFREEGQSPVQLTSQGDAYLVALSDDASQVAYARELDFSSRELWAINTDGSDARVLVDSATFQKMTIYEEDLTGAPLQLDWLPGTNLVVFSTRIVYEGPGMVAKHEVRTVNANSRTMTLLAEIGYGGEFSISPDGSQIALSLPDRISLVNRDGSGLRELFSFPHLDTGSELFYYPPLSWTLDSTIVRLILPPEHPMFDLDVSSRIISLPTDGSSPRIVGEVLTIPVLYVEPILSPDARQLAYVGPGLSEDPGAGILYTSSFNGSGAVAYDDGEITLYAWSPDNRHFLYSANGLNKIGNIGEPEISFQVPGPLSKTQFFDPSHYLFVSRTGDQQQLWLGDLDGAVFLIAESSTVVDYDFVK